ncbi:MAG: alanine dehydrogenase [Acidimicrobiia bacterium]|jgi:alanine dehydrogenase|nr:MAG: alanine dehydrogenase [Acidimicrobiia bacterium]
MTSVGIPTETKPSERRVALTTAGVHELVAHDVEVRVQAGAGFGAGIDDADYAAAGATIVADAADAWAADIVCKVKEPQAAEFGYLRDDLTLFTFLHLAAYPAVAEALVSAGTTAIAYETVERSGRLPLLAPMSEVAGRISVQAGATHLEDSRGGRGVLLGGVPGVTPAHVVVVGAGHVGWNAARMAAGMGARVTILDLSVDRLRELDELLFGRMTTITSSREAVGDAVAEADLVIGAVLVPGAKAPHVITEEHIRSMQRGAVVVDVAIDQGGCVETSRETSHREPTFVLHDVVHYAVGNMPGAVPRTSTFALTNATTPYLVDLAAHGLDVAVRRRPELGGGINIRDGSVTHPVVAGALA